LDLSGNWIEGNKPKADDKYKAQVGSALLKVSGALAKVRGKVGSDRNALVGGVFSAATSLLSRGHATMATKSRGTGSGGSGALARLLRSSSGGCVPLVLSLRLAGCGLEARHVKLLERAAAAANNNVLATGDGVDTAAVVLDLRLNLLDAKPAASADGADDSSSDASGDESREVWASLEGPDYEGAEDEGPDGDAGLSVELDEDDEDYESDAGSDSEGEEGSGEVSDDADEEDEEEEEAEEEEEVD
jgi:hypothetical protein